MRECPNCSRLYSDDSIYCPHDGVKLVRSVQMTMDVEPVRNERKIPPPAKPIPMKLRIIDQGDEGHKSRLIDGVVLDLGRQGMRIQTGTIETGRLNIIRDHTVAFKNKLELEIDLPTQRVNCTGFASWYRPEGEGLSWVVGVYIRDMSATDRRIYDEYLEQLAAGAVGSSRRQ